MGIPSEAANLLATVKGLFWCCPTCRNFPIGNIKATIKESISQNLSMEEIKNYLNQTINVNISSLKESIMQTIDSKLNETQSRHVSAQPNYVDVVNKQSRIVIKPKNNQNIAQTKTDILTHINPAEENIQLCKVKNIADGGILLTADSCSATRVRDLANERLAEGYEVRELKSGHPKITIVGLSEEYSIEELQHLIRSQNRNIFNDLSELSVIKIWSTKKNANIYQAKLQLDIITFKRIKEHNSRLMVGLDSCNIYDATSITRCFKCNGLGHSQKFCRNSLTCPLCTEPHQVKDCHARVNSYKCVNCCSLNNRLNLNIDTNHAVWNKSVCHSYKQANKRYRADILGSTL